jgi:hypothetical protein
MKLHRSITVPIRSNATWHLLWASNDMGLIAAWEQGRAMRSTQPTLASAARNGQLILLPWKGGVEKLLKLKKYGTLKYMAMWQGLRGDDLVIDTEAEIEIKCATTGMRVVFTNDAAKFSAGE